MRATARCTLLAAVCGLFVSLSYPASARLQASSSTEVPTVTEPSKWCIAQKTAIDCDLRDDCVWCIRPNSKFGTGCYPMSAAKMLPDSWGVVCDKDPNAQLDAVTCDGQPEASCAAPDCVWCTSAAVGGGCYTPAEAQLLPKAIFKCKTAPAATSQDIATY